MVVGGAVCGGERERMVEGDQAPAVSHGQGQQVDIGDLAVTVQPRAVDEVGVQQADRAGPELVIAVQQGQQHVDVEQGPPHSGSSSRS
ncbi:hypothetical protein FHU43_2642 [Halopolyspora algeriensis]|nr:hypothetical protein FHU43_2642 [Halopolyspora algeriensis]